MTKKTRLIILIACLAIFFVAAPYIVLYSMGYRVDFENKKIVATGGIYVRTFPAADQITIDSNISQKPRFFANSVFVQSLLPKNHSVFIQKSGYYDYSKTLPVSENEVTKLENIMLIKKDVLFEKISDNIDFFSIAPNQNIITAKSSAKNISVAYLNKTYLIPQAGKISEIIFSGDSNSALIKIENLGNNFYYLFSPSKKIALTRLSYLNKNSKQIVFNPQDSKNIFYLEKNIIYSAKGDKSLPIINNATAFKITGQNILWLSVKNVLFSSNFSGDLTKETNSENKIFTILEDTYFKEGNIFLKINSNENSADYKILTSPDNKNLIYWNSQKIYLYSFDNKKTAELFSGQNITNCQWINSDYIIFSSENEAVISEIDYRGNINKAFLEPKISQEIFNPQSGKVYILSENSLQVSEKITP